MLDVVVVRFLQSANALAVCFKLADQVCVVVIGWWRRRCLRVCGSIQSLHKKIAFVFSELHKAAGGRCHTGRLVLDHTGRLALDGTVRFHLGERGLAILAELLESAGDLSLEEKVKKRGSMCWESCSEGGAGVGE